MPLMQFVNGQATTPSVNGQSATDVSIEPTSLAGFPTNPQFTVRNQATNELMLVTAVVPGTPNTWTVTRGFGGSIAQPITAGDTLEYNITREMLLGGFVAKIDEQVVTAQQQLITLTVPNFGITLRGLRLCGRIYRDVTGVGANIAARWGGDATLNYYNAYQYSGSGDSWGTWNGWNMAYLGWIGGGIGSGGSTLDTHIDGLGEAVRTRFDTRQFYNGSGSETYVMHIAGEHRVQTAFSTIVLSVSTSNNVWANGYFGNGTVLSLYGVP